MIDIGDKAMSQSIKAQAKIKRISIADIYKI